MDGWIDGWMDGMVKFLPIMLGKMCQLRLLEWMDDGQIAASQHGWIDGWMDGCDRTSMRLEF